MPTFLRIHAQEREHRRPRTWVLLTGNFGHKCPKPWAKLGNALGKVVHCLGVTFPAIRSEGLHFTFIELPKFTPHSIADKRMMVLWLRFLTEINSNTKDIPSDLLNDPEIGKAVEELEISGFSDAELRAYDKFWDSVSVERTLLDDSYQKGKKEGMEEGIEKGMNQRSLEIARKMLANEMDEAAVMDMTGLTAEEIKLLKAEM